MTGEDRRVGRIASALLGAVVGIVAWLVIVPWDLSTHDAGRAIPGAPSETAQMVRLFAALGVPYVLAVIGAAFRWIRPLAFSVCSGLVWIVLTTWRGSAAEVSGANMAPLWPVLGIPLAMVGSSLAVVVSTVVDRMRNEPEG